MRKAKVFVHEILAGRLFEKSKNKEYLFVYEDNYKGPPVSLTMPVQQKTFEYDKFPSFFEGVLPEGQRLDALLHLTKLDRDDYFDQLVKVGDHLVGAVNVEEELSN